MILSRCFVTKTLQNTKKRFVLGRSKPSLFSSSSSNPPVDRKFDEILSFHNGVAAVRERNGSGAYHIDRSGAPVYSGRRYKRAFGFYAAQRAAVMDFDDTFFHIDLTGRPVYGDRYSWCGNFHAVMPEEGVFRSPVRDSENRYYYIDHHGVKTLGPFSYAGDPNSAGHSVVHDLDGNPTIIDVDGRDWCTTTSLNERKLIEACVPHKGIAQVRDEGGWFYMNHMGQEVGHGERYLFVEPHYNGQARVRFLNGQWGVVNEAGEVVVSLGESMLSSAVELEKVSKRYWESFALKHILENNVLPTKNLEMLPSSTCETLRDILKDCSVEMGLLDRKQTSGSVSNPPAQLLNRGMLLTASSHTAAAGGVSTVTEERCKYWLQDRYLKAWLDFPRDELNLNTFAELAADPASVERSQNVLKSYADADWQGAAVVLSKLLNGQNKGSKTIRTIVDMGGGYGSLLKELKGSGLLKNTEEFICIDRPEVVAASLSSQGLVASMSAYSNLETQQDINSGNSIKHQVGDLFDGPLRQADLYLMSRVLHDWSDLKAAAILDRLHSMSPENSRLCVIDRVSTLQKPHALLSLHMFALQGSRERNHEQWQELFASSGWKIDGHEHFNGHEMYLLTKETMTSIPSVVASEDTFSSSAESSFHNFQDVSDSELVEAAAVMPTVRKAVITAGGLGTRMAPQSAVTPKALLPVISRGNLMKPRWEVRPALSLILDQFYDACHTVDQVYVVSTPQHIPLLEKFLRDYHWQQLATTDTTTTGTKELKVQIITQHSAGGFGDAVLASRQVIGDEPFVLAVGDHIFSATCVKDILASYKEIPINATSRDWRNIALTGATLCTEFEVQATGLLSNQQSEYRLGSPWLVHRMVEKPRSNYESFQLSGGGSVKYPSQLGIDVLPPSIFTVLQAEKDRIAPHEEVDLRKVLQESIQGNGALFGCFIDGNRLDIGNPKAYFSALQVLVNDDVGVYQPTMRSSEVQEIQEQDKILQHVRALQLGNTNNIPATLRHALFGRDSCSSSGEIHISSSPGRMDLMGGFADYSGSHAIQHPTAERLISLVAVEENANFQSGGGEQGVLRLACIQVAKLSELSRAVATGEFKVRETAFPTKELFTAVGRLKSDAELRSTLSEKFTAVNAPDLWGVYLTGIVHRIYHQCSSESKFSMGKDFTVVTVSDLPWNTGLASSAAVEVATAISLGKALKLPADMLGPVSVSMMCKEVENSVVGAPCGILDQLTVTHPGAQTIEHPLVGIRCRMPLPELPTYSLPLPEGISVIALESGVKRSTASTAYQTVRTSSIVGKAILKASCGEEIEHLCDMTPSQFLKYEDRLPETMTGREIHAHFPGILAQEDFCNEDSTAIYPVRAATRFPIEENHRVQVFQDVLRGLHSYAIPRKRVCGCWAN